MTRVRSFAAAIALASLAAITVIGSSGVVGDDDQIVRAERDCC